MNEILLFNLIRKKINLNFEPRRFFREKTEVAPVPAEVAPPVDSSIDVGILKFQPQTVEFKDLQAKPEGGENPNMLISSLTEEEINEV